MTVRRLRVDEVAAWRDVRLRALADAPDAFEATHADWLGRPETAWVERTRALAEDDDTVMFVAEEDGVLVGAAGAFLDESAGGLPHLISMWVAPDARGRGVGRGLTAAVLEWASGHQAPAIRLFVVAGNEAAAALYQGCGFAYTGLEVPMRRKPELLEREMRRGLD